MTSTLANGSYVRRERPAPARRTVERRSQDGAVLGQVELAPKCSASSPIWPCSTRW